MANSQHQLQNNEYTHARAAHQSFGKKISEQNHLASHSEKNSHYSMTPKNMSSSLNQPMKVDVAPENAAPSKIQTVEVKVPVPMKLGDFEFIIDVQLARSLSNETQVILRNADSKVGASRIV